MHVHFDFETVASLSHHAVQWDVSWGPVKSPLGRTRTCPSQPGFPANLPPCLWLKKTYHTLVWWQRGWCKFFFGKYCILLGDTVPLQSLEKSTYKAWNAQRSYSDFRYKDCSGFTSSTKILQSSLHRSKPETPRQVQSMANGSKMETLQTEAKVQSLTGRLEFCKNRRPAANHIAWIPFGFHAHLAKRQRSV